MFDSPRLDEIENRGIYNACINGGLDFWQRGISQSGINGFNYLMDRFLIGTNVGGAAIGSDRSTDLPSELIGKAAYSMLVGVNTPADVGGTGGNTSIVHRIEGRYAQPLYGHDVIVDFWVKSNVVGAYNVVMRNDLYSHSYIAEYTIDQADTWERKRITIPHGSALGTWETGGEVGMRVSWTLTNGDLLDGTIGAWNTGSLLGSGNTVNWQNTVSANFYLAGVMIYKKPNVENLIPDFQRTGRTYSEELELCQRYFEKSYNLDTPLGTSTSVGGPYFRQGGSSDGNGGRYRLAFKTRKRIPPVGTVWALDGTINACTTNIGNISCLMDESIGEAAAEISMQAGGTYIRWGCHWAADAEL